MDHFIGSYECKLDSKGRIMMPVAIKKQLNPILSKGFVIKRAVFNNCLELYPIDEWNVLMERVNSLNRFNKKNNDFIRRFTAGVRTIKIDSSGRLLIPKNLISYVNIKVVQDKKWGQSMVAEFKTDNLDFTISMLVSWCKTMLPSYAIPKVFTII